VAVAVLADAALLAAEFIAARDATMPDTLDPPTLTPVASADASGDTLALSARPTWPTMEGDDIAGALPELNAEFPWTLPVMNADCPGRGPAASRRFIQPLLSVAV
jgi:hypothetical protein